MFLLHSQRDGFRTSTIYLLHKLDLCVHAPNLVCGGAVDGHLGGGRMDWDEQFLMGKKRMELIQPLTI